MDDIEKVLSDIYYNVSNPASYSGKQQLIVAAKAKGIDKESVEEWLKSQDTYTLFKPRKQKFSRLSIIVDHVDDQWQADLLDMSWFSRYNEGIKFLLVVIDCLSRYAWVRPLKNKSAISVKEAFEDIFRNGRIPKKLQTDQGKEFVNTLLKSYLNSLNINHFTTTSDGIKCAIAERFNRTIRSRIYRYLFHKNTHKYNDVLQQIVDGYNNSFHRAIKMKPSEVNSDNELRARINVRKAYKKKPEHKTPISEGKFVRIARSKGLFEKGATTNLTEEILKIQRRKKTPLKYIYKLVDHDGEPITSLFYPEEINEVKDKELYKIEKVLRTRKNPSTKKIEYFVKWYGYPAKFNSWVTDIQDVQ